MTEIMHTITVRRVIRARRESVFDAFSKSEALTQWFSPSPDISVEVLTFEFTPEGRFRLRYTMPDGVQPVVGGVYEEIARPDRLAFSWIWEPPYPHADVQTRVLIQFVDKGDATEVVLTHDRLPSEEAGQHHADGWEGIFDRLSRFFPEMQ